MSDLELKIKRITIAAESRGIRINQNRLLRKIRRLSGQKKEIALNAALYQWGSLDSHRRNEVRQEARAMHLACNFLRGRDYMSVEPITYMWKHLYDFDKMWAKLWDRVRYHVERHCDQKNKNEVLDQLGKWEDDAKAYASDPARHSSALEWARARSIDAKNRRREEWQRQHEREVRTAATT